MNLKAAPYPTVIVLGGGFFMDGRLTNLSRQRLDAAVDLYKTNRVSTLTVLGERKSTYLSNAIEFEKTGAEKRAEYLINHGISTDKIIRIPHGRDTIGEALAVKETGCPQNFLLLTSDLHIPRAHWVFQTILGPDIQIDDYPVPSEGLLIAEEESAYLAATQDYFKSRPDILNETDDWHSRHTELYARFKSIHDAFHPKGQESEAYCAVK